jgi:hypothetical protein
VLIPAVESNHRLPGCEKKLVLLFCHTCGSQGSDDLLTKLMRHGVIVTPYPPHASHIFKRLDDILFGVLKRAKKYQKEMIHSQAILIMFDDFSKPMRSRRQSDFHGPESDLDIKQEIV